MKGKGIVEVQWKILHLQQDWALGQCCINKGE